MRSSDRFTGALSSTGVALAMVLALGSWRADARLEPQAATPQPTPAYVGDQTCLACHDDIGKGFSRTPHGREQDPRSPASARGCETCHGPGQEHVESGGDTTKIRSFETMAAADANTTCRSCHNRSTHAQWSGSAHDTRSVSCVTCHSVHAPKSDEAQLKTMSERETCAPCHRQQALKMTRSAHMAVREGKMACASCHNPHGSTNVKLLKVGNWINESCVSCHAEKRGPFLWEHAAGRESCVSCHDPHGSSNDRMLIAKPPMLCQRCHIGTRHPSTIYDNSAVGASNRLYGRSCVNCHQNIHGSNHPSGHTFLR